jgi:hypothetical protein
VTFQCTSPGSSQPCAIGTVFVTADELPRLILDHWLVQAELSEHGRLLRLICCAIEVTGQHLETLFQDAWVGRMRVVEGPAVSMPGDQLWVNRILAIAPADAFPAFVKGVAPMSSPTRPKRETMELRRNTSKQSFEVSRYSDKPPTCRSLVGGCLTTSARKARRVPTNLRIF